MEKNPFYGGENCPLIKDSTNTVKLTAEMFFGVDGHAGYFTRQAFIEYGKSLRAKEIEDFKNCLIFMSEGLVMGGNLVKREDRGGRTYIHPEFYKARARAGVKLILEHGVEGFISDYQNGYISVAFTLDALIEEANKRRSEQTNS